MMQTPLALFVYNRPWHTRQAVEALQANDLAVETPLYVFSDAARSEAHRTAVEEVRAYLPSITGFASVTIIERDSNLGLARSIADGVSRLCEEFGKVIVVEDDLITSPNFIEYMNRALERYADDDRVMQIAGYMFPVKLEIDEVDALFMTFPTSWGWATWRRAWQHYDDSAKDYERLLCDAALQRNFDLGERYPYFKMLQAQRKGINDSWAIRWYLNVFMRQGLTLYPKSTLVRNLGFDGSGVNCAVSTIDQAPIDHTFKVTRFPPTIDKSPLQDWVVTHIPRPKPNLTAMANRLFSKCNRLISKVFR